MTESPCKSHLPTTYTVHTEDGRTLYGLSSKAIDLINEIGFDNVYRAVKERDKKLIEVIKKARIDYV